MFEAGTTWNSVQAGKKTALERYGAMPDFQKQYTELAVRIGATRSEGLELRASSGACKTDPHGLGASKFPRREASRQDDARVTRRCFTPRSSAAATRLDTMQGRRDFINQNLGNYNKPLASEADSVSTGFRLVSLRLPLARRLGYYARAEVARLRIGGGSNVAGRAALRLRVGKCWRKLGHSWPESRRRICSCGGRMDGDDSNLRSELVKIASSGGQDALSQHRCRHWYTAWDAADLALLALAEGLLRSGQRPGMIKPPPSRGLIGRRCITVTGPGMCRRAYTAGQNSGKNTLSESR